MAKWTYPSASTHTFPVGWNTNQLPNMSTVAQAADTKPVIRIGNITVDEATADDLLTLLDALMDLPDSNELKQRFVARKVAKRITR